MSIDLDWAAIRPLDGSKHGSFEELCTQLARAACPEGARFYRKGRPDSGVEAYAVLPNGSEWAWQAKYFGAIGDSQWVQLDESVSSALSGHPKMTRYVVCTPLDLPDGRLARGKSARARWTDRIAIWTEWANHKHMAVEFVWQGSHELYAELAKPQNYGLAKFFFGTRYIDDSWLRDRLSEAHRAAGPRYTAKLNVDLPIAEQFQAFGRTPKFFDRIRSLAIPIQRQVRRRIFSLVEAPDTSCAALIAAASLACNRTLDEFRSLSDDPTLAAPLNKLRISLLDAEQAVGCLLAELLRREEGRRGEISVVTGEPIVGILDNNSSSLVHRLQMILRHALERILDEFIDFAHSDLVILKGEAGVGKTHLLCDLANHRLDAGLPTVVLMGQRFLDISDPWTQALHQLDLTGWTAREFVAALEVVARRAGRRLLFIVDAINEGAGTHLWPNHLSPFLERLAGSRWIAVLLSVRSSYCDDIVPEAIYTQALCVEHHGFEHVEFDAMRTYFEHYGIDLPSTPLLAPEFRNPLYLKTICQGLQAAGESRLPRGFRGVVRSFDLYLSGVNGKLARELDFDARKNLVAKALDGLARHMVKTQQSWLTYSEAEIIVNAIYPRRDYSRSLMPRLVTEGLLIEEWSYHTSSEGADSVVMIAYERLCDYLCVGVLLDEVLHSATARSALRKGGRLDFHLLRTKWARAGFHEALHTLLAERTGHELLDLLPSLTTHHHTTAAFLNSVVWRDPRSVTERTVHFVLQLKKTSGSKVVETLITLATIPDHPLNAHFLDCELRKSRMAIRDCWWSTKLHALWEQRSAVDRLIRWCNRLWPHSNVDDEVAELTATAIAWLLSSPNRNLRDHATKSLVRVITWRPALICKLIQRFAALDDAYVAERVMAAAYGATMRSIDAAGAKVVADTTHLTVFANGRPRPHALLREYSRGIIKRAEYLLASPSRSPWPRVDPPYASDWPVIPDQAAIDSVVPPRLNPAWLATSWARDRIRDSVLRDDFAWYVIGVGSRLNKWLSVPLTQPQWVSSKRPPSKASKPSFDLALVQRYVLGRVFELGWTEQRFEQYDIDMGLYIHTWTGAERMGKKYQWIAYHEMLAFLSDCYQYAESKSGEEFGTTYQGSWQESFRDIDPSDVTQPPIATDGKPEETAAFWAPAAISNWNESVPSTEWVRRTEDVPLPSYLQLCRDERSQTDWVSLYMDVNWTMPRQAHEDPLGDGRRVIRMTAEGAMVKRSDLAKLRRRDAHERIAKSWSHRDAHNQSMFLGEVGWSPSFMHFQKLRRGDHGWARLARAEGATAFAASQEYSRRRGTFDCSFGSQPLSLRVPSQEMLELMGATWSGIAATYVEKASVNTVLAFDPSANVCGPSAFLVRRDRLLDAMRTHDLVVCWMVHGEKMDTTGVPNYHAKAHRLFHGLFSWGGAELEGRYSFGDPELSTENF